MSATVIDLFTRRPVERVPTDEIARRNVLAECAKLGVPNAMAMIQARSAADAVRRGDEPSAAVKRAVDRAVKGSFPDGPSAA